MTVYFRWNRIIIFVLLVINAWSCGGAKTAYELDPEPEVSPKILFLNYVIKTEDDGNKRIRLINQITAEGQLKDASKKNKNGRPGDLICSVQNHEKQEIDFFVIENPLKLTVEFINDLGNFEKKLIELDSSQFSIRMQLHPQTRNIRISEWSESNPIELIQTKIE